MAEPELANTASPRTGPQAPLAVVAFQSGKRANGGLESLFAIARRLGRFRPLLITQRESEYNDRWRAAGFEVIVWPLADVERGSAHLLSRVSRNVSLLGRNHRFARLLRERGIQVVHCNDGSAMAMAGPGAKLAGAGLVLNIRDTALGNVHKWRAYRLMADEIVVLSAEMCAFAEHALRLPAWLSARAAPITSIYSIVDSELMSPAPSDERRALRAHHAIPPDAFAVGTVGAFVPKKQQLELLGSLVQAASSLPANLRFYLIGDFDRHRDAYARACWEVVAQSPLAGRVEFVGYDPDPSSWYRALDLTLLPSRTEGLARSTIESMASGTPVVAFDFCSAREILEAHGAGVVVAQDDFAALIAAVERFAADPALLRAFAARGVLAARTLFQPAVVVDGYERVYARALAASRARPVQSF